MVRPSPSRIVFDRVGTTPNASKRVRGIIEYVAPVSTKTSTDRKGLTASFASSIRTYVRPTAPWFRCPCKWPFVLNVLGDASRTDAAYRRHPMPRPKVMRVALKIAYDGRAFHGFARQPDMRTVEGEALFALQKSGIVDSIESANVRGASRTDAGVSAVGNILAFNTDASLDAVASRFNDAAKEVWAWAVAELPPAFDPRKARVRWYRYLITGAHDLAALAEAAKPYPGTHDFAAFASPDAERTRRHVDSLELAAVPDGIVIDVRAPSFLRGMVRRIVSALLAVENGDARSEDVRDALRTGKGRDLGQAAAE